MADIARITYNSSTDFYEVMDMLDKRLNDKGKNWRHVLKSLKVLDYCLHEGSELVVTWARKNIYIIKTLREFIHVDEDGRDVGASSKSGERRAAFSGGTDLRHSPGFRERPDVPYPGRGEAAHGKSESRVLEIPRHRT
jgi:hypothetical protein